MSKTRGRERHVNNVKQGKIKKEKKNASFNIKRKIKGTVAGDASFNAEKEQRSSFFIINHGMYFCLLRGVWFGDEIGFFL
jgi:hypothetical protein